MPDNDRYYLNRSVCDVLEEMRNCCKTLNFSPLMGLIEETQTMVNRMEAALADVKDVRAMQDEWHRLKKEIKDLRDAKHAATGESDDD